MPNHRDLWRGWQSVAVVGRERMTSWREQDIASMHKHMTSLFPTLCARIEQEPAPRTRFLQFIAPICYAYREEVTASAPHGSVPRPEPPLLRDTEYVLLALGDGATWAYRVCYWSAHCAYQAAGIISAWKRGGLRLYCEVNGYDGYVGHALRVIGLAFEPGTDTFSAQVVLPYAIEDAQRAGTSPETSVIQLQPCTYQQRTFTKAVGVRTAHGSFAEIYFLEEPDVSYVASLQLRVPAVHAPASFLERTLGSLLLRGDPAEWAAVMPLLKLEDPAEWTLKRKRADERDERPGKFPRLVFKDGD